MNGKGMLLCLHTPTHVIKNTFVVCCMSKTFNGVLLHLLCIPNFVHC